MKTKALKLSHRYKITLRDHLRVGPRANLAAARGFGAEALAAGLKTRDLATLHEEFLVTEILPEYPAKKRASLIKQAGIFFAAAIAPIEKTHPSAREATALLARFIETLSQRSVELAASNVELSLEISQRKAAEEALRKSEQHYTILLRKSDRLQEELRRLSREILQAQEEERKEISRELHDVIVQTLAGINVRLAHLAKDAVLNTKDLDRNIARTQEMVLKSVDTIHRFARNLRPAMLDDLGLIPALEAFMKSFTERTGVRTHLAAYPGVDNLTMQRRTALFRVVQEALTNVGRHARASVVHISIAAKEKSVLMEIKDDGKSFNVHRVLNGQGMNHLGLLGMRERMEMVGGTFAVDSVAGQGTTVSVEVPLLDNPPQGKKPRRRSSKPIAVTAP